MDALAVVKEQQAAATLLDPLERLLHDFRQLAYSGVAKAMSDGDGHCKHYEGQVEFSISFPNYFRQKDEQPRMCLQLHCYVFGPGRHYQWSGERAEEVFASATADVKEWIAELDAEVDDE